MAWVNLLLALALPALAGAAGVTLLNPAAARGRTALVWGNGLLLGLMLTTFLMRLQDVIGLPLAFSTTAGLLCTVLACELYGLYACRRAAPRFSPPLALHDQSSGLGKALYVTLAVLIVVRIMSLGLELVWRPLFPWDATMHWATKARVWFDAASILPFVENQQWLEQGDVSVYTDNHPGYPITVPLLQVWINSALGVWDESLMNLPWLLCLIGLAALFYGQGKAAGVPAVIAMAFTYMLVSMPLLDTHVALAGYADFFLGTSYCAALAAVYNWSRARQKGQAALALLFAICCPLIKNEGFFWMLTLVPALLVVLLPAGRALLLLSGAGLGVVLMLLFFPRDMMVAGHSLAGLDLYYRSGVWQQIVTSLLLYDNWHLFGYLALLSVPLLPFLGRDALAMLLPVIVALASAFALFLFLFLFTRFAFGAVYLTAVGRISLHLVPGTMFFLMLFYSRLLQIQHHNSVTSASASR